MILLVPEAYQKLLSMDLTLLQTPNSPVAPGTSGGRKTRNRIILVCHGTTQSNTEVQKNIDDY